MLYFNIIKAILINLFLVEISFCKVAFNANKTSQILNDISNGQAPLTNSLSNISEIIAYNSKMRPSGIIGVNTNINEFGSLRIFFTLSLRQIISLDERQQVLTTSLYLLLKWNDPRLMWDPNTYNQIEKITVPASSFWLPDLAIMNAVTASTGSNLITYPSNQNLVITNNGNCYLTLSLPTQQTRCKLDVFKYPFDTQICNITIGSWINNKDDIDFFVNEEQFYNDEMYVQHPIWLLKDIKKADINDGERFMLFNEDLKDKNDELTSNDIDFVFTIKRNPLYIMINGIFPCLILNCVILIAYALPFSSQVGLCKLFICYSID